MAKVNVLIYRDPDVQDGNMVRVFANREEAVDVFKGLVGNIMNEDDELDTVEIQRLADELNTTNSVFVDGEDEWYWLIEKEVE